MELRETPFALVSAVDRFGMAEAFAAAGCDMIVGDLMLGWGSHSIAKSGCLKCCGQNSGSNSGTPSFPYALPYWE